MANSLLKAVKPSKAKVKAWLLEHGHKEKAGKEQDDYINLVAEYHDLDPAELRRLLGV